MSGETTPHTIDQKSHDTMISLTCLAACMPIFGMVATMSSAPRPLSGGLLLAGCVASLAAHLGYPLWWMTTRHSDAHPFRHGLLMLGVMAASQVVAFSMVMASAPAPTPGQTQCGTGFAVLFLALLMGLSYLFTLAASGIGVFLTDRRTR